MAYVVEERSKAQAASEPLVDSGGERVPLEDPLERQVRQMHRSDGVPVTIVCRAWEGELGEAELSDVAETLKERMINDGSFAIVYLDGSVDRVPHLQGTETSMRFETETAA